MDRLFKLIEQRAGHWLAIQVEDAKIALTDDWRRTLRLDRIETGLAADLERPLFDAAIALQLERLSRGVDDLLARADLDPARVDSLFFTGGSSGIPALRQALARRFPGARLVDGDRFGNIGNGLAIEAFKRYG